ncbi:tail assembly chaperone [Mycobacterium phage Imvubu]|uniref:Uncharacterized protein n=1 Tax=Mycobacterium phage Imvubu TaxID=2686233 RepID=A0A6B9LDT3_9CAUD|nr:tail assembly chaperone [Mycobacterium phage Imvubu]QHB37761.1 hypothetical protein PBI_IMVUBU_20 [Mycobacterium phage Imvubu]
MTQPQMTPPNDGATPTPVQPLTDAERAAATAQVAGTAMPSQPEQPTPVAPPAQPTQPTPPAQPTPVADPPPAPSDSQVVNEVASDEPGTEVAAVEDGNVVALADRFDVATSGELWPHGTVEFKGDTLGIRLPTRQALAAFSLASSKYVSLQVKNDLTGLFIARHLSPESYGRVFSRLMDPDEDSYDVETVGELFNVIVMAAVDADKADDAG